jgi:hypothetical protein
MELCRSCEQRTSDSVSAARWGNCHSLVRNLRIVLKAMVACTLVVRGVCSLALLDQVLLRLSTCLMGGSETNSTPLVLLRPSTGLMVSSEENSTPLVLLRLSNSLVLRGLRRELDPSCFTASQYGSGPKKTPKRVRPISKMSACRMSVCM